MDKSTVVNVITKARKEAELGYARLYGVRVPTNPKDLVGSQKSAYYVCSNLEILENQVIGALSDKVDIVLVPPKGFQRFFRSNDTFDKRASLAFSRSLRKAFKSASPELAQRFYGYSRAIEGTFAKTGFAVRVISL